MQIGILSLFANAQGLANSCSSLEDVIRQSQAKSTHILEVEGCLEFKEVVLKDVVLDKDITIQGKNSGSVVDFNSAVHHLRVDDGATFTLKQVAMKHTLLLVAPPQTMIPVAVDLHDNSKMVLQEVVIETLCTTLSELKNQLGAMIAVQGLVVSA